MKYLSSAEVATRLGIHPKTFTRYVRTGKLQGFPAARELAPGLRRWISSEVEEWMQQRPAARRPSEDPESVHARRIKARRAVRARWTRERSRDRGAERSEDGRRA